MICKKIGKPSAAHAAAMCNLFPSSSAPKCSHLNSVFDPTQPFVAFVATPEKRQLDASLAKLI